MKLHSYFKNDEDILLLNTQYVRSDREAGTPGVLYLTYRDNKTKQKKVRRVENPKTETFITKLEYRMFPTQRRFLEKDKLDSHLVKYESIPYFIKSEIVKDGRDSELLKVIQDYSREAYKWRHSYFADYNINDYAMMAYRLSNMSDNTKISTAYLDIESDIYQKTETEIEEGRAPMNAVSVVMPYDELGNELEHPRVFTLLLRNYRRYKDQEYFETHIDKFISECHDEFDDKYNSPNFIIRLYDDEVVLFKNLFALLHKMRPDFILIWNMSYDIPTMIKRLKALGENPVNYFCHPDFDIPRYQYNYDNIYKNDLKNKSESFDCTCYSQYIDQMLNYAGLRKAKRDYGGNKLDNVANIELKARKRVFDSPATNVTNATILEYWNFVKYSINDVLLQYGIDKKTGDTVTLFEMSLDAGTRMSKTLKQSVYHKNYFAIDYFKHDIVPGNNCNVSYISSNNIDISDKTNPDAIALNGALVGDPMLNGHRGIKINGERSMHLFKMCADQDFASMYPNIKIKFNIAAHTQFGRIIFDKQIIPNENPLNDPKFMRVTKFMEDFESGDAITIGKWLKLPNTYTLILEYAEEFHPNFNEPTGNILILTKNEDISTYNKLILHAEIND